MHGSCSASLQRELRLRLHARSPPGSQLIIHHLLWCSVHVNMFRHFLIIGFSQLCERIPVCLQTSQYQFSQNVSAILWLCRLRLVLYHHHLESALHPTARFVLRREGRSKHLNFHQTKIVEYVAAQKS